MLRRLLSAPLAMAGLVALPLATPAVADAPPLGSAVAAVQRAHHGRVSVAVMRDGRLLTAGTPLQVRAASLTKLLIVDAALAQGPLTGARLADATGALERSDNAAATRLWSSAGGNSAVARVVARLHLHSTRLVAADLEPWDGWVTSAADQVRVVSDVAARGGVEQTLLGRVESDQRWGVAAAAPAGSRPFAKDGWLPVTGGWLANSAGCLTPRGGHLECVAVLTSGSPTYTAGTVLTTAAARAALG